MLKKIYWGEKKNYKSKFQVSTQLLDVAGSDVGLSIVSEALPRRLSEHGDDRAARHRRAQRRKEGQNKYQDLHSFIFLPAFQI
jgi:hypothetical protein